MSLRTTLTEIAGNAQHNRCPRPGRNGQVSDRKRTTLRHARRVTHRSVDGRTDVCARPCDRVQVPITIVDRWERSEGETENGTGRTGSGAAVDWFVRRQPALAVLFLIFSRFFRAHARTHARRPYRRASFSFVQRS